MKHIILFVMYIVLCNNKLILIYYTEYVTYFSSLLNFITNITMFVINDEFYNNISYIFRFFILEFTSLP